MNKFDKEQNSESVQINNKRITEGRPKGSSNIVRSCGYSADIIWRIRKRRVVKNEKIEDNRIADRFKVIQKKAKDNKIKFSINKVGILKLIYCIE